MSAFSVTMKDMRVADLSAEQRLRLEGLTPREIEVTLLAGRGFLVREVAEELCIAPGTAKTLLKRAREKLGAPNLRQLSVTLLRQGLITAEELLDRDGVTR